MIKDDILTAFQPLIDSGLEFASTEKQKGNGTYVFKAGDGRELDVYTADHPTDGCTFCKRAQFKRSGNQFYSQLKLSYADGSCFINDFGGLCELAMKKIG